jgi:hypothetical protein
MTEDYSQDLTLACLEIKKLRAKTEKNRELFEEGIESNELPAAAKHAEKV